LEEGTPFFFPSSDALLLSKAGAIQLSDKAS